MGGKAPHFGCTSHVTTNTKVSTTIQQQIGIPCSESYKFNKFQNFDGISHGTFYSPMGQSTALLDNT